MASAQAGLFADFVAHPDHGAASSFVLGALTLQSLSFLLSSTDAGHLFTERIVRPVITKLDLTNAENEREGSDSSGDSAKDEKGNFGNGSERMRWVDRVMMEKADGEGSTICSDASYILLAALNALALVGSLCAFGSLLAFPTGGTTGCAFLTAWAIVSLESSRTVAISILLLELRRRRYIGVYELYATGLLLFVRIGGSVVSTALDGGFLQPVFTNDPNHGSNLCLSERQLGPGALTSSADLLLTLYTIGRLGWRDWSWRASKSKGISWRRELGALLDRNFARACSLLLLAVAAFAGSIGRGTLAARWVPQGLAFLLLLVAYNPRRSDGRIKDSYDPSSGRPRSSKQDGSALESGDFETLTPGCISHGGEGLHRSSIHTHRSTQSDPVNAGNIRKSLHLRVPSFSPANPPAAERARNKVPSQADAYMASMQAPLTAGSARNTFSFPRRLPTVSGSPPSDSQRRAGRPPNPSPPSVQRDSPSPLSQMSTGESDVKVARRSIGHIGQGLVQVIRKKTINLETARRGQMSISYPKPVEGTNYPGMEKPGAFTGVSNGPPRLDARQPSQHDVPTSGTTQGPGAAEEARSRGDVGGGSVNTGRDSSTERGQEAGIASGRRSSFGSERSDRTVKADERAPRLSLGPRETGDFGAVISASHRDSSPPPGVAEGRASS